VPSYDDDRRIQRRPGITADRPIRPARLVREFRSVTVNCDCSIGWEPRSSPVTPGDDNAEMTVTGTLIAESLLKNKPLEGVTLQVRKVSRGDVGDVCAGQLVTWTFIEFDVDDQVLAELVEALRARAIRRLPSSPSASTT